jgi:hypothetical protein
MTRAMIFDRADLDDSTVGPGMTSAALVRHVALALALLVALTVWVGTAGFYIVDEAALYGQLEMLDQGEWTRPLPAGASGSLEGHLPMALSHVTNEGWAPFAKHPLHVALAHVADGAAGRFGVRMLSVLGTVAAAATAALLCRSRGQAQVAFWLTALLSPLVFYSQLVLAHTIGAAVAGLLALVTVARRASPGTAAAAFALAFVGSLLRNEFLLLGFSFALVLSAVAMRRPFALWRYVTALACAVGSLSAWLLEPRVVSWLVGTEAVAVRRPSGAGSSLLELGSGAVRSVFDPTLDSAGFLQPVTLVLSVVLGFLAVVVARHRPEEQALVTALAVGAVVSAALHLLEPHVIRGIVFAFPLVLLLLVLRRREALAGRLELLGVSAVFALAVFATQYTLGGGPEWGWRYSIVAVPLVAPALGAMVISLWQRGDRSAKAAITGFVLATALIVFSGLVAQRQTMSATAAFLTRTQQVVAESGVQQVVYPDPFFGRYNHRLSTDGMVAKIDETNSANYLKALAGRSAEPVLLVWPGTGPPPALPLGPYRITPQVYEMEGVYRGVKIVVDR